MIISVIIVITLIVSAMSFMGGTFSTLPGASNGTEATADYIIFKSSAGLTYAKNGSTGIIDYASSNVSMVFTQAIQHLPAIGGMVYVKAGNYALTSPIITARNHFALIGALGDLPWPAQGGAKLTKTGNFDLLQINGYYDSGTATRYGYGNIYIKDISLGNLGGTGSAINASYTGDVEIDRVYIGSFQNSAIYAYGCYGPNIHDCYIVMNEADTVSPDINITGDSSYAGRSTAAKIMNNIIENPNYCAVAIDHCDGAMIKEDRKSVV